jgi:EAL domain-containing protein (putative c-di-GMP-specific phosphodiesterase class I)
MRSVLLLDDEPAVLSVLSDYLTAPGLEIITCREIEAAEAVLEHGRFDVVVTDLRVSELGGLEGMRLIRWVSTHFPETTVLAMSGYVNDDVHALGRAVGATAVLEKPIDLRRLRRYVHGEHGLSQVEGAPEGRVMQVELLDDFLAQKAIQAFLQPIVTVAGTDPPFEAHGFEALARAPAGTPLRNPEILFSYASRKERLFETDSLCILAAVQETMKQHEQFRGSKLFINTQPRSMTNPEFVRLVNDAVANAGFSNDEIVFELTEQQTIVNPQAFARTLQDLREAGFAVALDDYGVGFANLRLVQDLRPDYVKISGYFCRDIHKDKFKQHVVRSTAEMCDRVGIPTILESVETLDELEVVKTLGVTYAQGYFFARPAPSDELVAQNRFRPPSL